MSTRLILIRHGRTEWNHDGRFQGQADVELDAVGRAQAMAMASRVALLAPGVLLSSLLVTLNALRLARTSTEMAA